MKKAAMLVIMAIAAITVVACTDEQEKEDSKQTETLEHHEDEDVIEPIDSLADEEVIEIVNEELPDSLSEIE